MQKNHKKIDFFLNMSPIEMSQMQLIYVLFIYLFGTKSVGVYISLLIRMASNRFRIYVMVSLRIMILMCFVVVVAFILI